MKKRNRQSIQVRMAALVGALALTAAIMALVTIFHAAQFQEQLAVVEKYAVALQGNTNARLALASSQTAVKNTLISGLVDEERAEDYGAFYAATQTFDEFLFSESLRNRPVEALQEENEAFHRQVEQFYDTFYQDEVDYEQLVAINLEEMDPTLGRMDEQLQAASLEDLDAMRAELAAIAESTRLAILIGQAALLLLAALIIWGVYETMHVTIPLDHLTSAVVAFENKVYAPDLLANEAHRADELGELARAVDGMAQSITRANQIRENFLTAAQKFVPTQYLEFLEKEDIASVRLGDHVSAEMAVMFSDIRGFTSMSEKMTARENFDFVNEYLQLVSPIIQKHEGFIVKFLGDGMMAIFPYGVADAVNAGIEKSAAVQAFNQQLAERGLPPISVGIGVHTGPMMVGMIGEELRMQGDAFSDNVNLTSRIEGLNKFYGTSMIISEDTLAQLPKPVNFKIRSLGKAVVKGRAGPLGMFEVYSGLPEAVVALKDATRPDFENGVNLFAAGKIAEAVKAFKNVLAQDPGDKSAREYLDLCADLAGKPLPAKWDGAIVMDAK